MNTLNALAQLENADFSTKQAKAIIGVVEDSEDLLISNLAKKEDVEQMGSQMKAQIEKSEAKMRDEMHKMRDEMHKMEIRLIKWVVGAVVTNGIIATILAIVIRAMT